MADSLAAAPDAVAVAYARDRLLPAFFEHLIRDCLRHKPEGRKEILRHLRHAAQRRHALHHRGVSTSLHRVRHRIGDTKWEVTGLISHGNTSWFGGGAVINVRKGIDTTTGEDVAIKVFQKSRIARNQAGGAVLLLMHKMMQLSHPNVVEVKDVKHTSNRIYLVMELAPGRVDKELRSQPERRVEEARARKWFRQLIVAVEYFHQKGVAHGDINLSLFLLDKEDNLKLSHVGTSVLGLGMSTGGPQRSTWGYAAPEVFSENLSREVQQTGDIWSCGVCLFEMLTGLLPFDDERDNLLLGAISRGAMGPAARLLPAEARDLLKRVFVPVESRLSIGEVKRHPWVCAGDPSWFGEEVTPSSRQHVMTPPPAVLMKGVQEGEPTSAGLASPQAAASPVHHGRRFSSPHDVVKDTAERTVVEEALAEQASFTEDVDESSSSGSSDDSGPSRKPFQPKKPKLGFGSGGVKKVAAVTAFRGLVPQVDPDEEVQRVRAEQDDTLDLSGLKLEVIPAFADLSCVKYLYLTTNVLESLPDEVGRLVHLEELKLRQNKLTSLPDSLGQLTELRVLFVDDNLLTGVPESLGNLQKLEEVGLDWNKLDTFPSVLLKSGSLRHLHMVSNPLRREEAFPPPEAFAQLAEPVLLRVHNAPWILTQIKAVTDSDAAEGKLKLEWTKIYPDRILPFMFLGPLSCCQDPVVYKDLGIGYIASIGRELSVVTGDTEQIQISVDDVPGTDLVPCFDHVHEFIDKAKAAGSAVLVHCFKGQSRSATLVATYLMKKERWMRDEALAFIRQNRPCINPNPGFMTQMLQYEVHLGLRSPGGS